MTSHNTASLCDDPSVTGRLSVLCLQDEGRCGEQHQSQAMIDMLPDDVLLEIFDFYREDTTFSIDNGWIYVWRWVSLIQVCRRWRWIIFGSPRRLDLRVVLTDRTPTRALLDIWPPFPISVACQSRVDEKNVENFIAAVEHGRDRISQISIDEIEGPALEKLVAAMQQPLPALTCFCLTSYDKSGPVLSETFLSGSAPLLETFDLYGIPFPTFPQFISSSTHIRDLFISGISHSGYISPDAMVACLAALPNLDRLDIGFRSPLFRPSQITPPPHTRIVLPALTRVSCWGVSEYFEDFLAQIDTPLLNGLDITFFMDLRFDIPQLRHFIGRAERLKRLTQAVMEFSDQAICVGDSQGFARPFSLQILCERADWQLSSMVQIFGQQLPLLSHVEQLDISQDCLSNIEWTDNPDMDSTLWLESFRLFVAVHSLRVSEKLVPPVAAALRELTGERTMEVFPALQSLSLEGLGSSGPVPEGIRSFVAARQLSDHHVAVQSWDRS